MTQSTYLSIPIPPKSSHLWRYTPWVRAHPTGEVDFLPSPMAAPDLQLSTMSGAELPKGIVFEKGKLPQKEDAEDNSHTGDGDIAVAFLNEVTGENNWLLTIPPNLNIPEPLILEVNGNPADATFRIDVDVGENSTVSLVTWLRCETDWLGESRRVRVGLGAKLNSLTLNSLPWPTRLIRCEEFEIHDNANVQYGSMSLGGRQVKSDSRFSLNGRNAHIGIHVASHNLGNRHDDNHFEVDHDVGGTNSILEMHSVVDDEATSTGTGILRIPKHAGKSEASQTYRAISLSKNARANAIPELEVLTDDVSATHGAASGPLSEEQLHYLMSRGMDRSEAEATLVEGFLATPFKTFGNEQLREWIQTRLCLHLGCRLLP